MRKQLRCTWALVLVLTMILSLGVPGMAVAADPPELDGTATLTLTDATPDGTYTVADGSGSGTAAWVQSSKTLTLTNFQITFTCGTFLTMPDNSVIELTGTNEIKSTSNVADYSRAINCTGALTIQSTSETGTLTLQSGNVTVDGRNTYALNIGTLTIKSGTIKASAGTASGTSSSFGVYATTLIMNGGTLNAYGGQSNKASYGICTGTGGFVMNDGIITAQSSGTGTNQKAIVIPAPTPPAGTFTARGGETPSDSNLLAFDGTNTYVDASDNSTIAKYARLQTSATKTLHSIAVTDPPTKTDYMEGETFSSAGMVVTATYFDRSTETVGTYSVSPNGALTAGTTSVTISYTEDGVTRTASQPITVNGGGGDPTPPTPPAPVTTPSLSVSTPSFGAQKIGYTRPAAEAIGISNTGDAAATISSVSVSPSDAFEVSGSGSTVAVGGSISSWKIQPKADLPKGSYSATVTVSYNGKTATGSVSFAVVDSDAPAPDPEVEPIRAIQASSDQEVDLILRVLKFIGERYPVTIRIIDQNGKVWLVKDGVVLAVTEEAKEKQVKTRSVGNAEFKLTPKELEQLPEGEYTLWLSSEGNAQNQPMPEVKVGVLIIQGRADWSVPGTFRATTGISYQLVTNAGTSTVKVRTNKPETIGIDENGRITGTLQPKAEDNVASVVFEDEKGNTKTCAVTVVANRYERELPLRLSGKQGVFSSTKLMSYNGKNLEVETFLLNKRKSKTVYKAGKLVLVIYKSGVPVYKKELSTWRMMTPLKYNGRAIYKVTITPDDLKKYGAPEGPYDLASGAYEVVLTRPSNVTAVLGNESNIVVQKGIEVKDMIIRNTGGLPMMENLRFGE